MIELSSPHSIQYIQKCLASLNSNQITCKSLNHILFWAPSYWQIHSHLGFAVILNTTIYTTLVDSWCNPGRFSWNGTDKTNEQEISFKTETVNYKIKKIYIIYQKKSQNMYIQGNIEWEDRTINLKKITKLIWKSIITMGYFNICAQEMKITTVIYKLYENNKIFLRTTDFIWQKYLCF